MKLKRNYSKLYQDYNGNHEKHFSGQLSPEKVFEIYKLVNLCNPTRILDYGSGKGFQYLKSRVHDHWGGLLPHCYDPGVRQLAVKPEGLFDGIICTDVMEHIDEDDVDTILCDIFASLSNDRLTFAFFHISTRPAGKTFDNGENVHLTVQPPEWWNARLERFKRPGLTVVATYGD